MPQRWEILRSFAAHSCAGCWIIPDKRENLKLVSLPGGTGRYATLSYCWGATQDFCTTMETLEPKMKTIDESQLPKAIQDAVWMTQQLGIPYLWVDSLCIIQDDPEDKNRQIAKMGDIYSNSTVTIVAAAAPTCHDSFLIKDYCYDKRESRCITLPTMKEGVRNIHFCTGLGEYIPNYFCKRHSHVIERVWTFQEEFLSPRLIAFFSDGFRWACRSGNSATNEDAVRGVTHHFPEEVELRRMVLKSGSSLDEAQREAICAEWAEIVVKLSRRGLTYPNERLVAITALAEKFSVALENGPCLAGLWESQLRQGLFWICYHVSEHLERPPGPTWPWASVPTEFKYPTRILQRGTKTLPKLYLRASEIIPISSIVPFGAVSSAKLSLRAGLRRLDSSLRARFLLHSFHWRGGYVMPREEKSTAIGFVSVDRKETSKIWWQESNDPAFCLRLAMSEHLEDPKFQKHFREMGLVLKQTHEYENSDKTSFVRVGVYWIWNIKEEGTEQLFFQTKISDLTGKPDPADEIPFDYQQRLPQYQEWDETKPADEVDFDLF